MLANKSDKQQIFFLNLVCNCWYYSLLPPQGLSVCSFRRVARIWKRGGAFLKEWEKCKRPWPEFSLLLNQFHTVCPKIETKFLGKLRNSKVFSAQNQVVSKKKRSSPKLRLIFRPKLEIQTFFPPKFRWSPKKKKNQVVSKKRSSPKLRLIFRPNSEIQTFEGSYFQFFTKNRPQKEQNRAILHTSQANGRARAPPPPLATLLCSLLAHLKNWCFLAMAKWCITSIHAPAKQK